MSAENPEKRNRIKSAVIIAVTLVIGMVLGGLITAQLAHDRMDRIAALRSQRGFARFIERSIDYESPAQQEAVHEILDRTSVRMFEHLRRSREETASILDSARDELGKVLSPEQMEHLEQKLRRHSRDRPGPMHRDDRPPRDQRP